MKNTNKPMILIIEDDLSIRNLMAITLETHNYSFETAKNGNEGMMITLSYKPDVIILDLGLPDIDGVEIIKKVRSFSATPIIVVSARGEDKDKIQALDEGADDYITKPFSVDELLARIRVALRRVKAEEQYQKATQRSFQNAWLKVDYLSQCVWVDQKEVHLTPIEYKLLYLLTQNVGRVLTYNFILKEVWGVQDNDSSALRVFMTTLRKKIDKKSAPVQMIQTHMGVGYRMLQIDGTDQQ